MNQEFGTDDIVSALTSKAEDEGHSVELDQGTARCYDGEEQVAQVTLYGEGQSGGSIASIDHDGAEYSEVLQEATEEVDGVGYNRGQVTELEPATI